ncbi:MAG: hypothetical protein JWO89_2919 [Verrucomicrobiaceae bacterium]|nr:hypothetical protein [Verrucomicrobiaceae bacterium]
MTKDQGPATPIFAWLGAAGVLGFAVLIGVLSLRNGVRHSSNFGLGIVVLSSLAGAVVAVFGILTAVFSALDWRRCSIAQRFWGVSVALLALLGPYFMTRAVPGLSAMVERRDFEEFGPARLRQAVADVLKLADNHQLGSKWDGRFLSPNQVPPVILEFIPDCYVIGIEGDGMHHHALTIRTDGLGSFRGGYMILPTNSPFVPPLSRRVADGFYYFHTRN